jgi:hypothetical protein
LKREVEKMRGIAEGGSRRGVEKNHASYRFGVLDPDIGNFG